MAEKETMFHEKLPEWLIGAQRVLPSDDVYVSWTSWRLGVLPLLVTGSMAQRLCS